MLLKINLDFLNSIIASATFITTIIAIFFAVKTYSRDRDKIIIKHSGYQDAERNQFIRIVVANIGRQPITISEIGILRSNIHKGKLLKRNKEEVKALRKGKSIKQREYNPAYDFSAYDALGIVNDIEPYLIVMPGTVAGQPIKIPEKYAQSFGASHKYVWAYSKDIEDKLSFSSSPVYRH